MPPSNPPAVPPPDAPSPPQAPLPQAPPSAPPPAPCSSFEVVGLCVGELMIGITAGAVGGALLLICICAAVYARVAKTRGAPPSSASCPVLHSEVESPPTCPVDQWPWRPAKRARRRTRARARLGVQVQVPPRRQRALPVLCLLTGRSFQTMIRARHTTTTRAPRRRVPMHLTRSVVLRAHCALPSGCPAFASGYNLLTAPGLECLRCRGRGPLPRRSRKHHRRRRCLPRAVSPCRRR